MKPILSLIGAATALALALPAPASAAPGPRNTKTHSVNTDVFEVVSSASGRGYDIWCAASDYARRSLNAPWNADIYVARGIGVSEVTGRKSAVQFTLNPSAADITPAKSNGSLNSFVVGDHMSVQSANNFCGIFPGRL